MALDSHYSRELLGIHEKNEILVDALLDDLFYNFIEGLHNVTGFGNSSQEILTKFSLYLSLAVLYFYKKSSFTLFSSKG